MTKKATIRSTPQKSSIPPTPDRSVKKSREKAIIICTADDSTKKTSEAPISSPPDRSVKKSREKAIIICTADDSTKKSSEAPISSPPARMKWPVPREPDKDRRRHVFVPGTIGPAASMSRCRYCKRSFLSDDLSQHIRCCYRFILDKGEVESSIKDEDDGKVSWLRGGKCELVAASYAKKGLAHLNKLGYKKFKIVRPGPYAAAVISGGPITHFNFKAKAVGSDLIETFFCQLRRPKSGHVFDVLKSLGPSNKLPSWDKANLQNCAYCEYGIHHPCNLKDKDCEHLLRGRARDNVKWLYGPDFVIGREIEAEDK